MRRGTLTRIYGLAAIALASLQFATAQTVKPTMMDFLQKDGRFQIFVRLAKSTGVDMWFKGDSITGCTIVAPTDDAFSHVPQGVLDSLNKNRESMLKVIQYHVMTEHEDSAAILKSPPTLEGDPLNLTGGVPSRTAHVLSKDVVTSNGTVHVIDQVLFPPAVFTGLQRDGVIPMAVGLGPPKKMTAAGVVTGPKANTKRTTSNTNRSTKRRRSSGHWVRITGTNRRIWVPNTP